MIYLSKTNRDLTQKYINFAQKGLQGSIQLDPLDIINKVHLPYKQKQLNI